MTYVIVRADGGVSIMHLHKPALERSGLTADRFAAENFEKWVQSARPEWLPARLEKSDAPLPDDAFHGARMTTTARSDGKIRHANNAWVWDDAEKRVKIDMPLARENFARRMIRQNRGAELAALDVAYQRADEQGSLAEKASIARRKQILRDAPADPRIDAAQTPEDLKRVWPEALR